MLKIWSFKRRNNHRLDTGRARARPVLSIDVHNAHDTGKVSEQFTEISKNDRNMYKVYDQMWRIYFSTDIDTDRGTKNRMAHFLLFRLLWLSFKPIFEQLETQTSAFERGIIWIAKSQSLLFFLFLSTIEIISSDSWSCFTKSFVKVWNHIRCIFYKTIVIVEWNKRQEWKKNSTFGTIWMDLVWTIDMANVIYGNNVINVIHTS